MFWSRKKSAEKALEEKLDEARETVTTLMKNADKLSPAQQQELRSLMAAAGIASSSLRIAQTIRKADAFGDKMHEQTMKMIEEAHAMTSSKPALDPAALADAAKKLQAMVDKEKALADEEKQQAAIKATAPITVYKPLKLKSPRATLKV